MLTDSRSAHNEMATAKAVATDQKHLDAQRAGPYLTQSGPTHTTGGGTTTTAGGGATTTAGGGATTTAGGGA